ncbi:MAG: hypothetical protein ACOC2W_00935 [bacterium]
MENESKFPQKESLSDALNKYKNNTNKVNDEISDKHYEKNEQEAVSSKMPNTNVMNQNDYENSMTKEVDPDLITSYEIVKLPSEGKFYSNGLSEVKVEYMTSKDEDVLTSVSLIEKGEVFNELLKRKIKTPGVNVNELLDGDRSAIILFLRTSSYGPYYDVRVPHPETGKPFETKVDLTKLKYKEMTKEPDEEGLFQVQLPMRKKTIKFRLLNHSEIIKLQKKAEELQNEFNEEYSQFNTMKIKAHVVSIDGKTDRSYINKFIDAMPALDSFTIRKEILNVQPEIDMNYEFETKEGIKFNAPISIGIDFFFPSI